MKNIFIGAKYGKPYCTSTGRNGLYVGKATGNSGKEYALLLFEDNIHEDPYDDDRTEVTWYNLDGTPLHGGDDIVHEKYTRNDKSTLMSNIINLISDYEEKNGYPVLSLKCGHRAGSGTYCESLP